jgi:hypothetical protein
VKIHDAWGKGRKKRGGGKKEGKRWWWVKKEAYLCGKIYH